MPARGFYKSHHFVFAFGVHHNVGNAAELGVLDRVHFLLSVAVSVSKADLT